MQILIRLIVYIDLLKKAGADDLCVSGDYDGYVCVPDLTKSAGPIAGVFSILSASQFDKTDVYVFVPVDMPLLTAELLHALIKNLKQNNAVFYQNNPLPFVLRKSASIGKHILHDNKT